MKLIGLFLVAVLAVACRPVNYTHPVGYKPCQTNYDCPKPSYCGFVGVDTYPVCKQ